MRFIIPAGISKWLNDSGTDLKFCMRGQHGQHGYETSLLFSFDGKDSVVSRSTFRIGKEVKFIFTDGRSFLDVSVEDGTRFQFHFQRQLSAAEFSGTIKIERGKAWLDVEASETS